MPVFLTTDPTAQPCLPLIAEEDGAALGHVLFTAVSLEPTMTQGAILVGTAGGIAGSPAAGNWLAPGRRGLGTAQSGGCEYGVHPGPPAYFQRPILSGRRTPMPGWSCAWMMPCRRVIPESCAVRRPWTGRRIGGSEGIRCLGQVPGWLSGFFASVTVKCLSGFEVRGRAAPMPECCGSCLQHSGRNHPCAGWGG